MPYILGNINYYVIYEFLRRQDEWYKFSDKVWVQHIDRINECTMFAYQTVEVTDCMRRSSFICEIGKLLDFLLKLIQISYKAESILYLI